MTRLDKIIIDAIFNGVIDFNKVKYIKDVKTLKERFKQVDIEFGVNLSSLTKKEQDVWYYMHNYMYKLNTKVNIDELINIGLVYNMTV